MSTIKKIPIKRITPQQGNLLIKKEDISLIVQGLECLEDVGIDGII